MVAHLAEALGDTQTAVRIGKAAIARGMNLVYYAYPDPLAAGLHAAAQAARARLHPGHRAPGERVQLGDPVGGRRARHPAGHAGDGQARVPRLQAQVRHPPPDEGPRLQHHAGQRLHLRPHGRVHRLLCADARRLQRRPRPGARMDQGVRRSRATARSIRSTGSTASPSRRRASTCRRCSPTSRSTAPASASRPTPCASTPTSSASRPPRRLPKTARPSSRRVCGCAPTRRQSALQEQIRVSNVAGA